jgi:hypothetical protein
MPFDSDSGLVFSEKVIKHPRKSRSRDNPEWTVGRPPELRSAGDGSDSLYLVALRKLLCNLNKIDTDSLVTVPEGILVKIWKPSNARE